MMKASWKEKNPRRQWKEAQNADSKLLRIDKKNNAKSSKFTLKHILCVCHLHFFWPFSSHSPWLSVDKTHVISTLSQHLKSSMSLSSRDGWVLPPVFGSHCWMRQSSLDPECAYTFWLKISRMQGFDHAFLGHCSKSCFQWATMKNEVMIFFGTKCGLAAEKSELPPPPPLDCIVCHSALTWVASCCSQGN